MRLALFLALAALPLAGLGACRTSAPSAADEAPPARFASEADYQTRRAAAVRRLDAAIGEARATDVSACRAVPVGAKACGGPVEYRVYSSTTSVVAEVERFAEVVTALDTTANRQFERVSDCMLLLEPTPTLVGGRCVAAN